MTLERLIVIGAGAIGGCVGGLLFHSGLHVEFVARGEHGRTIRDNGLEIQMPDRVLNIKAKCVEDIRQIDWLRGDVVMLATKLQDADTVLSEMSQCAGLQIPILCATNGIQAEHWAETRFDFVMPMMVWMPATHLEPGCVKLYSQGCLGILDIGQLTQTNRKPDLARQDMLLSIRDWLRKAGFDSEVRENIMEWKYAKWITNLGNAAQALVVDDWKSVARAAQAEGESVLKSSRISRVPTAELLKRTRHVKLEPIDGEQRQGGSTWQSFHQGKPLETRWIEGAMVELAETLGVDTPVLRFLAEVSLAPRAVTANEVLGTHG